MLILLKQSALKEHDQKQFFLARQHLIDIRNIYATLTDMIHKNIDKVSVSSASPNSMFTDKSADPKTQSQQRLESVLSEHRHHSYIESLEYVEAIQGSTNDGTGDLGMPVQLLDVLLPKVLEQQLGRNVFSAFGGIVHSCFINVLFNGQVPKGDLVVSTGCSEDGVFRRVPFDRGDRALMPRE